MATAATLRSAQTKPAPEPSPDCAACASQVAESAPESGALVLVVPGSPPASSTVSPLGYAVGGAVGGWVLSAFFGMSPLVGIGLGGAGGYMYGRSR